jgi:hypothetical protein
MAATYDYGQYTVNGKTVHLKWLETSLGVNPTDDQLTVRDIGNNTAGTSGYYGVNGVLFNMKPPYTVCCYAMQNGSAVRTGGDDNNGLGCMIRLNQNLGDGTFLFTTTDVTTFPFNYDGYQITQNNVKWALGGINLRLEEPTLTESQFYNGCEINLGNTTDRPRTAIGYKGGRKIILCAIFDGDSLWEGGSGYGCNMWDVRTIMKNKFGCTMGINLDGGWSTQIAYKLNGQNCVHELSDGGYVRPPRTMVTVPM